MSWKSIAPPGLETPAGVPGHDLTDAEFAELEAWYDAQFPDQRRSLRDRWFRHVTDKPAKGPEE